MRGPRRPGSRAARTAFGDACEVASLGEFLTTAGYFARLPHRHDRAILLVSRVVRHPHRPVPILRRAIALVLLLSVNLSTLGMAHARCAVMDHGQSAAGTAADHHIDHAPAAGRGGDPGAGAPDGQGTGATCRIAAHCATAMIAADRQSGPSLRVLAGTRSAGHEAAPVARTLEPDSPPPRA